MMDYIISQGGLAAAFDHGSEPGEFEGLPLAIQERLREEVGARRILYVLVEEDLAVAFSQIPGSDDYPDYDDDGEAYWALAEESRAALRRLAIRALDNAFSDGRWFDALRDACEQWERRNG